MVGTGERAQNGEALGSPVFPEEKWYARRDSNPRPSAPEGEGRCRCSSGFGRYRGERSGVLCGKKRKRADSKGIERNLAGAPTGTLWAPSHSF